MHAWSESYDRFAAWVEAQGGSFGGDEIECVSVGPTLTQEFKADFDATLPDTSGDATFLAMASLPGW